LIPIFVYSLIILGLDPGTATTGFGIIRAKNKASTPGVLAFGTIDTSPKLEMPDRLLKIHLTLAKLIKKYKPDAVSIEEIFFNTNDKTAVVVSEARGVMLLTAKLLKCKIFEYTPLQVKSSIVGYGRAEKKQVEFMVRKIVKLPKEKIRDDAIDAIGLALTHLYSSTL
jgi:crossover junction endodeoxyribonuclease RuvC